MKPIQFFVLKRPNKQSLSFENIQWPENDREAIAQAFMLMAYSINMLRNNIVKRFPSAKEVEIQSKINKLLADFNNLDKAWSRKKHYEI
jgi:hypothetical protein